MNAAQLKGAIEKNKKPIAVAGAALVGGLALLQAKRNGPEAAAAKTAPAPSSSPLSAGGRPTSPIPVSYAAGAYDSSSADVYNAIQPQLEEVSRQNASLRELMESMKSPIPVAAPPPEGIYRNISTGGIYNVDRSGNRDLLSPEEWIALGYPQFQNTPGDSAIWKSTQLLGTE